LDMFSLENFMDNALIVSKPNCDNLFHSLAYQSDNIKSHLM